MHVTSHMLRPIAVVVVRASTRAHYGASPYLEGYRTLKEASDICETIVKNSKFISRAWPIEDVDQAKKLIAEHSDPKASHNCYAYKMQFESKYTDDGEPSGTGGKPIFNAIQSEDVDHVCVLVTRYFGGTKLGAGPLGRAYGNAARQCLRSAQVTVIQPTVDCEVRLSYDAVFQLHSVLKRFDGKILAKVPTPSGLCVVTFRVGEEYMDEISASINQFAYLKDSIIIKQKRRPF